MSSHRQAHLATPPVRVTPRRSHTCRSNSRYRKFPLVFNLDHASTTATLQHCPARLVPAPSGGTGATYFLHTASVAITTSSSRGTTMPMGIYR
jgi:hypothetical protein